MLSYLPVLDKARRKKDVRLEIVFKMATNIVTMPLGLSFWFACYSFPCPTLFTFILCFQMSSASPGRIFIDYENFSGGSLCWQLWQTFLIPSCLLRNRKTKGNIKNLKTMAFKLIKILSGCQGLQIDCKNLFAIFLSYWFEFCSDFVSL